MAGVDGLMASALHKTMPKKLQKKIDKELVKTLGRGTVVSGRQHIRVMYGFCKAEPTHEKEPAQALITKLKYYGDSPESMQAFVDAWGKVLANYVAPPSEETRRDFSNDQTRQRDVLQNEGDRSKF